MPKIDRHCDSDCMHSKACDADALDQMQEYGYACVDCGVGLTGRTLYGAGDGTGQRFRCADCHIIFERSRLG